MRGNKACATRVRRPWNHQGISFPLCGEDQRAGLASSNSSNHSPEMWVYRILIPIVCETQNGMNIPVCNAGRAIATQSQSVKRDSARQSQNRTKSEPTTPQKLRASKNRTTSQNNQIPTIRHLERKKHVGVPRPRRCGRRPLDPG